MLNGKFIATITVLISIIFLMFKLNFGEQSREPFWGNASFRSTPVRVMQSSSGAEVALPSSGNQFASIATPNVLSKGGFFQAGPQFQAQLSPRSGLASGALNAYIRYNPPSQENMAFAVNDPLTIGNMARENYSREDYCGSCGKGAAGCGPGGLDSVQAAPIHTSPPNYAASNYNQVKDSLQSSAATTQLPVGDMTMAGPDGDTSQPITYDRFIYSNKKSRLWGQQDLIRGSVAIAPPPPTWFRPSVNPQIDLNAGAMAVLGGIDNSTSQSTYSLINAASGGTFTTMGGVNLATQQGVEMSAGSRDVGVTAFP